MGGTIDSASFYSGFWNEACRVTSKMEAAGCYFDTARCLQGAARAAEDAAALVSRWEAVAPGVNPESPLQLSTLLYDACGLQLPPIAGTLKAVRKTKRGERPTSEASLDWLLKRASGSNKEMLDVLMVLRRTTKLAQFLSKLPGYVDSAGYLYAAFGPDTGTGRLASRNPNLQNIPGVKNDKYGIRSCFVAPPGMRLLVADYSALEPRILGHWLLALFGDSSLTDAIAAGDVYGAIAKRAWPAPLYGIEAKDIKHHSNPAVTKLRDYAKVVFLAKVYGKQIPGMALQMGTTVEEAAQVDADFLKAYPGVLEFQEYALKEAQNTGHVKTLLGRSRPIANANSDRGWEQGRASRQATNTKIQGSAADIVFGAMVKQDSIQYNGTLQMQIHDELVWRVPAVAGAEADPELFIAAMRHPFKVDLLAPLEVEWKLLSHWGAMK